jgi:hypothetical protein
MRQERQAWEKAYIPGSGSPMFQRRRMSIFGMSKQNENIRVSSFVGRRATGSFELECPRIQLRAT